MDKNELIVDSTSYETTLHKKFLTRKKYIPKNLNMLHAIIPGGILQVFVKAGDVVHPGDSLLILEAMKMKNDIKSIREGKIKKVAVRVGDQVAKGQLLLEFEA
ncbi:MAG: acetyl-CoA carboxylase biotin carboxyl carrier protein subunit [Ignavibacteriales bacterium]|nr:acetyl-CoA carboxylase biotin carboxyl carrier protein subunit [Ignavibacteriales bacterium]